MGVKFNLEQVTAEDILKELTRQSRAALQEEACALVAYLQAIEVADQADVEIAELVPQLEDAEQDKAAALQELEAVREKYAVTPAGAVRGELEERMRETRDAEERAEGTRYRVILLTRSIARRREIAEQLRASRPATPLLQRLVEDLGATW